MTTASQPSLPPELGPLHGGDPGAIGPFRLVGRLGHGGMGVVYGGLDEASRCVAVKVIAAHHAANPEFRTRFAREIALVRGLRATCAPAFLGAEEHGDQPWLATEFVPGRTLREHVATFGPLRGAHLQAFAAGVAEGVGALHHAGVTHRDLKPGNVVLSPDGPKVLDFGIAHADGGSSDDPNRRMGTPGWMAPERMAGRPAEPANDVYCWGLLVAFAATGTHAFGDVPSAEVATRIRDGHIPDLSHLPSQVSALVAAALSADPAQRPTAESVGWGLFGDQPDAVAPPPQATAPAEEAAPTAEMEPTAGFDAAPSSPAGLSAALVPLLRDLWVGIDAAGHDPNAWRRLGVASGAAATGVGASVVATKSGGSAVTTGTLVKSGVAVVAAGAVVAGGYFAIEATRDTTPDEPAVAASDTPDARGTESPSPEEEEPEGQEVDFRNLTARVPEGWTEVEDPFGIEDALVLDTHNPDCVEPPPGEEDAYRAAASHCGHVVLYGPERIHAEGDVLWGPLNEETLTPGNRTDVGPCLPGMDFLEGEEGEIAAELAPIGDRDAFYREVGGTCGPSVDVELPELADQSYPFNYRFRTWYLPESEIYIMDEWNTEGLEEILAEAEME